MNRLARIFSKPCIQFIPRSAYESPLPPEGHSFRSPALDYRHGLAQKRRDFLPSFEYTPRAGVGSGIGRFSHLVGRFSQSPDLIGDLPPAVLPLLEFADFKFRPLPFFVLAIQFFEEGQLSQQTHHGF
jgi:hypothetical protein